MVSLKLKISSFKNLILAKKILFLAIFLVLSIFLLIIIILLLKTERPEIPSVPIEGWAKDLVSYWAFDEKGGQVTFDAKSRFHNGRLGSIDGVDLADPQRFKKGKVGQALKFDGKDDYLIVEDHPDFRISKEITLEGWFKVSGVSSNSPTPIWLSDFQYRRQIIVDNSESRESFNNFQLLITLDTASLINQGKLQSFCQDIRFTDYDETTLLPYWIETGCNTKETKIWVKIPSLPGDSSKNLYLYYGNPKAESQSNFYQTMETPPVKWWDLPAKEEAWQGKEIKALAKDKEDNIIAVGSDNSKGNLQWRSEIITPRGLLQKVDLLNYSQGADEINNAIFDLENKLILVGYDFSPGNSQWRAKKEDSFDFEANFSPGPDEIKAVAVDSENNIILAGYDSLPGNAQWRVVKLNSDGEKLWDWAINPSEQSDAIVDVKVDSRNNIIVAGYEKSLGNDRWRIEKLDPKSKLLYSYRLDVSDGADVLNSIAIDSEDNVIAVGYDFYPGDAQWRIIKLNSEGKRMWQWNFNPSPAFDELKAVGVDSDDNIIVAGYDSTQGDFSWQILKFSKEGKKLWEFKYNPSPGFDELKDMILDSENNIILAGYDFSLKEDPHWRVTKFSERKPVFPQPKILIDKEEIIRPLPANIIILKEDSYQVSANQNQITGVINNYSISAPLRSQDWNHFALTYDGVKQKLYLNGSLANSKALSGEIEINRNNLFIGYNFSGLIDELKIYKRALSPEEIRYLSNLSNIK